MPLTPPVLPADVEAVGALTPQLFRLADQVSLDAFVQGCIDFADSWMQGHMGAANYDLQQFPWQHTLQKRGQIYLALEAATDTLKAEKIYGTHYPLQSEESASYEALIDNEWGIKAMQSLDLWVTVESASKGFALPIFSTSSPIPEGDCPWGVREPLDSLYARLLDHARGISNSSIRTVAR